MSEPHGTMKTVEPWPPVVTGQQAMVAVLTALVDLLLSLSLAAAVLSMSAARRRASSTERFAPHSPIRSRRSLPASR